MLLFQDTYYYSYSFLAPTYYLLVYNIVKKAMSAAMVKKMHAFGRGKCEFLCHYIITEIYSYIYAVDCY